MKRSSTVGYLTFLAKIPHMGDTDILLYALRVLDGGVGFGLLLLNVIRSIVHHIGCFSRIAYGMRVAWRGSRLSQIHPNALCK